MEGSTCCNEQFTFNVVDLDNVSYFKFHAAGGCVIFVIYILNGHLYISISYDCGKNWSKPLRLLSISGLVKAIYISSLEEQFVIVLMEEIKGGIHKSAVSGFIDSEKRSFFYKECSKDNIKGKLLDVSIGFRKLTDDPKKVESVDYKFARDGDQITVYCCGHGGCKISDFSQG